MDNSWYFDSLQQGGAVFHFSRGFENARMRMRINVGKLQKQTVVDLVEKGLMSGRGYKFVAQSRDGKQIIIPSRGTMANKKKLEKLGFDPESIQQILKLTKPDSQIKVFNQTTRNNMLREIFEEKNGAIQVGNWEILDVQTIPKRSPVLPTEPEPREVKKYKVKVFAHNMKLGVMTEITPSDVLNPDKLVDLLSPAVAEPLFEKIQIQNLNKREVVSNLVELAQRGQKIGDFEFIAKREIQ